MIKTELEKLLEVGFYALGVPFSRRIPYDEIKLGSDIDDQFGRLTVKDVRSMEDIKSSLLAVIFWLTDYQAEVLFESVPLFLRKSEPFNGFSIEYRVYPYEDLKHYSEHQTDRLIKGGEVSEVIEINSIESLLESLQIAIEINFDLKRSNTVNVAVNEDVLKKYFEERSQDGTQKLNMLKQIDGQDYNAKVVYKAIINFIK